MLAYRDEQSNILNIGGEPLAIFWEKKMIIS